MIKSTKRSQGKPTLLAGLSKPGQNTLTTLRDHGYRITGQGRAV